MIRNFLNKLRTKMGKGFSVSPPPNATDDVLLEFDDKVNNLRLLLLNKPSAQDLWDELKKFPSGTIVEIYNNKIIIK